MDNQKERLNVPGAAAQRGGIYTFVWSAARPSPLSAQSAERPGGIYMTVHFVPPVVQG